MDIIERLPKVDLHVHLDGCVRRDTIREIACEEGVRLPTDCPTGLLQLLQVHDDCRDLPDYLSKFELPLRCMQSAASLRRIAYELVEDASNQGVKYMEVRFAPQLHTERGLSLEAVMEAVRAGLEAGEQAFGTIARMIVICMRSHPAALNMKVMQAARPFLGKGVAGLDLAGDEVHYPPQLHRDVFRMAHDAGFPITIHAGEAAGPENIRESITNMFARRIGHGLRLKEDRKLLEWVAERQIALEMCVTSNVQTKGVPDWKSHPVKEYFDQGVLVTLNTDNTTVSNTDMTKEIKNAMELLHFSVRDIANMMLNGVKASFLEESRKQSLFQDFRSAYRELGIAI